MADRDLKESVRRDLMFGRFRAALGQFVYNEELSNSTYCTQQLEVVMARKHSRPAAANTETARNGREKHRDEGGVSFYYQRKKQLLRNLNKGNKYFTLRTDTRIQNYKCFDSSLSPSPHRAEMGRRQRKPTSNSVKQRLRIPTNMIKTLFCF